MRIGTVSARLIVLLAAAASQAQAQVPANFGEAVNACFRAQHAATPFSGVVLAARGSDRVLNIEGTTDGSRAHSRSQTYRLASVGKVLTQVAIARLIDQGRVRLEAPISTYLPDLPAPLGAVTVEQLLQHRGGVSPMIRFTPDLVEAMRAARTARELVPLVAGEPLAFAPGTQMQYSNGGYVLLGAVIEAVSGTSYADFLQREILTPLGMSATSMTGNEAVAPSMTRMAGPGAPPRETPARSNFPALSSPAGDGVSSADDLLRLARALNGHSFLTDATKAAVFPRRGAAWQIGQAGGRPGANAFFGAFPELDASLVVLTNYDPPAGELMGMVLARLIATGTCRPLTPADMPGPMGAPPGGPRTHL